MSIYFLICRNLDFFVPTVFRQINLVGHYQGYFFSFFILKFPPIYLSVNVNVPGLLAQACKPATGWLELNDLRLWVRPSSVPRINFPE